jgi:hypothetical protein
VILTPYIRRQSHRLAFVLIADATTFAAFAWLVGMAGVHTERNPLISLVYATGGVMGVLALKLAAAWLLEWRARSCAARPVSRGYAAGFALLSSLAVAGTIVGAGMNTAALLSSTVLK